jgi:hypothetical protein
MNGFLLHGELTDVRTVPRGQNNTLFGEASVKCFASDHKGRAVETYVDLRFGPDLVAQGFENALRPHLGKIVLLPISPSIYEGRKAIQQYDLIGLPLKLDALMPQPAKAS